MGKLKIAKSMRGFRMAKEVELDCGDFDIVIKQVAFHNPDFKAALTATVMEMRKKTVSREAGTITGTQEGDMLFYINNIVVSWGKRPMRDDDDNIIDCNTENLLEIFSTEEGKVLFGKIQEAASDDQLFTLREGELGNS